MEDTSRSIEFHFDPLGDNTVVSEVSFVTRWFESAHHLVSPAVVVGLLATCFRDAGQHTVLCWCHLWSINLRYFGGSLWTEDRRIDLFIWTRYFRLVAHVVPEFAHFHGVACGTGIFRPGELLRLSFRPILNHRLSKGLQSSSYTLLVEYCPPRVRTIVGVVWANYWAYGLIALGGMSYAIHDWRWLQVAVTIPTALTLLFSW